MTTRHATEAYYQAKIAGLEAQVAWLELCKVSDYIDSLDGERDE